MTMFKYEAEVKPLGLVNENTGAYQISQNYSFDENLSATKLEVLMTTFCVGLFQRIANEMKDMGSAPLSICADISGALYKVYCNIADNLEKECGIPVVKVPPPAEGGMHAGANAERLVRVSHETIDALNDIEALGPPDYNVDGALELHERLKRAVKIDDDEARLEELKKVLAGLLDLKKNTLI